MNYIFFLTILNAKIPKNLLLVLLEIHLWSIVRIWKFLLSCSFWTLCDSNFEAESSPNDGTTKPGTLINSCFWALSGSFIGQQSLWKIRRASFFLFETETRTYQSILLCWAKEQPDFCRLSTCSSEASMPNCRSADISNFNPSCFCDGNFRPEAFLAWVVPFWRKSVIKYVYGRITYHI